MAAYPWNHSIHRAIYSHVLKSLCF